MRDIADFAKALFGEINKTQMKRLNTILNNVIKRIFRIPQTTPREFIYEELRIEDIEHRILTKRTMYAINLNKKCGSGR